jgi:hypothetical protein
MKLKEDGNLNYSLSKVDFKSLDFKENSSLIFYDEYIVNNIRQDDISVELTRHIYFEPSALFEITISTILNIEIEKAEEIPDLELVKAFIKNNLKVFNHVLSDVSLIIGLITRLYNYPLVTPPMFQSKEQ